MAGETAAKSFLEMIEKELENRASNYFGTDVDRTIREMRYTLLQCLSCCLSTLRNILLRSEETLATDFGINKWNEECLLNAISTDVTINSASKNKRNQFSLNNDGPNNFTWFSIVRVLTGDLLLGLKGESGEMTLELYKVFIEILGRVMDIVDMYPNFVAENAIIDNVEGDAACRNLWTILCEHGLRHASLLKPTLDICINRMPHALSQLGGLNTMNDSTMTFAASALSQCLEMLKTWFELKDKDEGPWFSDGNDVDQDDDEGRDDDNAYQLTLKGNIGLLRLVTPKAWSWALNCSLISIERTWHQSYKTFLHGRKVSLKPCCEHHNFSKRRFKFLRTTLLYLADMLSHVKETASNGASNKEEISPLCAELFPSSLKLRLCSLIEKVMIAIVMAVKHIDQLAKESINSEEPFRGHASFEAIVCVGALLDSNNNQSMSFMVQARKWYCKEKARALLARKTSNGYHAIDDPVVKRLPSVLFRIENCESSLQNLSLVLEKSFDSFGYFESILQATINDDRHDTSPSNNDIGSLLKLVINFVEFSSMSESFGIASILNRDDIADESIYVNLQNSIGPILEGTRRKKRLIRRQDHTHRKRKSRRCTQRSRNVVIDEWISIDETLDEPTSTDAFVELEDFIVEG